MNYREYCPERETMEKQLRAAYSEFLWVYETASKANLSDEDLQTVKDIEDKMSELLKKLRNINEK